ncbi:TetR/AcrR family transcriptional regulator C-terminal domain-containing protein [Patulibacter sp. S7RM1-6]
MPSDRSAPAPEAPLWTRLPAERPRRSPITRAQIVDAAIALADAEGLEAVTIRRVAGALDTRPMGLYSHIARKDDLLDLMLDRVVDDGLTGTLPADWRDGLRAIARRSRAVALRHPWIVSALGRRRSFGPSTLRHAEQSLAAVEALALPPEQARDVAAAVDTYVVGHLVAELGAQEAARRSDVPTDAWRRSTRDYLAAALDEADDLPHLAALGPDGLLAADDADAAFERGLEWLLSGIAAALATDARDAT